MYFLDVGNPKPNLNETDSVIAEDIIYNRDLIRGFTLSRITMIQYERFMEEVIGKYVEILTSSCEVCAGLRDEQYKDIATPIHNSIFKNHSLYAATCPEIFSYKTERGYTIATDAMVEQSTSIWEYEDIIYYIIYLFDDTLNYIPEFSDNKILIEFRQFIMDGLLPRLDDFYYDEDGRYSFDVYGVLKFYMIKKIFLGVNIDS